MSADKYIGHAKDCTIRIGYNLCNCGATLAQKRAKKGGKK